MVAKPRSLLVSIAALALTIMAGGPALAGYRAAAPDPVVQESLLRVLDIAATGKMGGIGPVVAVGWRQAAKPGEMFVAYSIDGGKSYTKRNGSMRQFRVAGDGTRGLSLDVCSRRVWAASVANFPGDAAADRDVLMTSRTVSGGAAQAFMTDAATTRKVTAVALSCVGNKLLAIAWLEQKGGKSTAKLMLRTPEPLGEPAKFRKVYGLGEANLKGGISVDASTDAVHVAWTSGPTRDLRYQRFLVASGPDIGVSRQRSVKLDSADIRGPQVAARGKGAVVVYSDAGKLRARVSQNNGGSFAKPQLISRAGSRAEPSAVHSADISGDRIVAEVTTNRAGEQTPQRVESKDAGASWSARSFGNVGARVGALRKTSPTSSLLTEAWQNNVPGTDTIRAQFEN